MNLSFQTACFSIFAAVMVLIHVPCANAQEIDAQPPTEMGGFKYLGTAACVQCHKDGHTSPSHTVAGYEYTIWANQDPHSCAYASLFKEQSLAIAKNLKLKIPPHKNDLCLNCHATNVSHDQLLSNSKHTVSDGVGCESCHGGAEQWLVAHKLPGWKNCSPSQKSALGFVNTDNIATRTRKCVECHVGSPGRDVNHDLIAAGHPRLYFEMSAYHAKMPRHWSRTKDLATNGATTEYKLWLVGQFVSAATALDQMQRRAEDTEAPWPEFADYDCFSCHHALDQERWKEQDFFAKQAATPDWGSWHFSQLENGASVTDSVGPGDFANQIEALRREMQNQLPERHMIVPLTENMKSNFSQLAEHLATQHSLAPADGGHLLASKETDTNWDALTQRYLAAVALRQSRKDSGSGPENDSAFGVENSRALLTEIRDVLKFRKNQNGPHEVNENEEEFLNPGFEAIFQQLQNQ